MPHSVLKRDYAAELKRWDNSTLFWTPPSGESMADVCMRVDRILNTLHRECTQKRVLIVCHGEVMWAFRIRLERMPQERWVDLDTSSDKTNKIFNGQIIHYTRRDPDTQQESGHLDWMRMIRANDKTFSRAWRKIVRPTFSNDDLRAIVERTPRLISG